MKPISIWRPERRGGEVVFVRPEPLALGDHYAARREIPATKRPGVRRVCFFGESVAAGYLYAPHVTPAGVLEAQLSAVEGPHEVVDLARTNETLAGLVETVEAARQLEPDALVVFVGNNWNLLETPQVSPYYPSPESRRAYARSVREQGWAGPLELAGRARLRKAGWALEEVAQLAGPVPVVIVVPEVNLADWEARQPPPWISGRDPARWHALLAEGQAALGAERWGDALGAAAAMLDLDHGICPTAFRIMSNALAGRGDPAAAREAAEAEVAADAYPVMAGLGAPRAAAVDQEVLRRGAAHHGWRIVDLPALFADHTGEARSGRRMFLDYCHLTAEGIRLAMAGVTAALTDRQVGDVLGAAPPPAVPSPVEATARLGAAIHTAHRHLPVDPRTDMVGYWLRAALAASPGVEQAMRDVAAARVAPLPEVLTAAQERNFASPHPLGFQHGWRYRFADVRLLEAIAAVFAAAGLAPLVIDAPPPGELLPYWVAQPLELFYPDTMEFADHTHRAFLRSPWPATALAFPTAGAPRVRITLTARLRGRTGTARVAVAGRPAAELALGPQWSRHEFLVPDPAPLSRLVIRWPDSPAGSRDEALDRLAEGLPADIHPVFGELFSVRADPA